MRSLIIANWKCNPSTFKEAKILFNSLKKRLKKIRNVEVVICPPFVYLSSSKFQVLSFKLGAQDVFWEERGAFTGEISSKMLKDLGVEYIILGHSERRQILKETDEMINKKIKATLNNKLKSILCIGETEEERKEGKTFEILKNQIEKALSNLQTYKLRNLIIAYEPIWAIGSGKPCQVNEAMTAALFIKKLISHLYNQKIGRSIRILYGGSVNSLNASNYIREAKMDGLLIGGVSLNSKEFVKIIKQLN
ncbi:triose-phosphate isomerase [bacterium (Candidatus Gribaldobacteria) CG07_land_8_20_14_0_80_33_18]|uniref:Triosephosphate isomerase n=1 Tax=bacterium (Candidatus Gribaldobacteria) CG07_land_8_20_14_0_80_33_18 TaxID=2014272 RepID=A0A2M6Z2W1_9BACT|nr:MAG: triose-phosphate isomerase [bacterium (Candidatus Gribaldobacteria) CG10_big_fil_rev_8_21_14_0_10_33_41]PIU46744.1 MAG: triose-phosphate isomerase [bacterium (Candidatus Gribaldobacteria) CG07_land_8_20_14_0_80_33_18]PJA00444.1 MAG: triose-phosphate isomerase [bacterium (Candidatus Gribaldobacteria) CG_4_10_14_0_2_um_filter_33_15]PJB08434.1 MAG: triose-phosphate isomerase [bacterium (Candidatus Gribaldobacteria) CG_4_9_14_3_um_filter_33_9]